MGRPLQRLALLVAVATAWAPKVSAQDPTRRLALVEPGPELLSAVVAALRPWGLQVLPVQGPGPGASAPENNLRARALAQALDAEAVAWLSRHDDAYALWVYDRASDHAVERAVPRPPPFDAAAAASVALTVKTLMRHSAAAPVVERFGAEDVRNQLRVPALPQPRAEPTPEVAPAKPSLVPPPPGEQRPAGPTGTGVPQDGAIPAGSQAEVPPSDPRAGGREGDQDAAPSGAQSSTETRSPESGVELWLRAGLRMGALRPARLEGRAALEALWWPSQGALGVGLGAEAGPAAPIQDRHLDGNLLDFQAHLVLALRHDFNDWLRLQSGLQGALHVLTLTGTVQAVDQRVSATRVVPALGVAVAVHWALTQALRAGLFAQASLLPRAERYWVEEAVVLELAHGRASAGISLSLALD